MALKQPPFDIDDPVHLEVKFYNADNHLDDPSDITLRLVCPDATVITKTKLDLVQVKTGVWQYVYEVANGWGTYKGTWTAEGLVDVVRQFSFPVLKPDSG